MSPRRKIAPGETNLFEAAPIRRRYWGLAVIGAVAALLLAGSITASALLLNARETQRRATIRDAAVLSYVSGFMTKMTSPDPYHANDYADYVMGEATGDFAKQWQERMNDTLVAVARAEPTTGRVVEAGVQRWNGDGSADVLVATTNTGIGQDGKTPMVSLERWMATAIWEGQQWKISHLVWVL